MEVDRTLLKLRKASGGKISRGEAQKLVALAVLEIGAHPSEKLEKLKQELTPDFVERVRRTLILLEFQARACGGPDDIRLRALRALKLRYGLEDGRVRTLREVAQVMGYSAEWVRRLVICVLYVLRWPPWESEE